MTLRLIVSAVLLLLVVLAVNMVLLFSSLGEPYVDAALAPYHAIGRGTATTLEDRLSSNKGLGTLSEISKLMEDTLADVQAFAVEDHSSVRTRLDRKTARGGSLSLMLTNGAVIHSTTREFDEGLEPTKVVNEVWET